MRYGSVCSGIEAATAAWHHLGWKPSFFSEIEAFPRAVLAHHYPNVPLHGDFTTIQGNEYDPIDLLVGGTPCQSFSIAGLRGGLGDDRGNLALQFLRLADRTRPRWLVWENVPGVLSSNGGRDFGSIIGGMVELGYGIAYRILDAQYFGVAQRRRRVFVVGYLGDWRRAAAVLFERHSLQGHPAPSREKGQKPAPTISARPTGGGGLGTDFDLDGGLVAFHAEAQADQLPTSGRDTSISDSLTTSQHAAVAVVAPTIKRDYGKGYGDGEMDAGGLVVAVPMVNMQGSKGNAVAQEDGPSFTLSVMHGHDVHAIAVAYSIMPMNSGKDYKARETDIAQPIMAGGPVGGNQGGDFIAQLCVTSMQVRRLTPRECERLQGFPDDYTFIQHRGKPAADGPRYKALGNSMAVPVMRWIGERIQMVENITKKI